jgi:hypothetical protein
MRKQNGNANQTENAANTTKTFFSDADGNGLYQIRFGYKQNMGPGLGFLTREGTCTLEASTKDEALEIFESLPAARNISRIWTRVNRISNGIIWNMNA